MRALLLLVGVIGSAWALEPVAKPLAAVQRIYVESLGGSPQAMLLRDMVIASIQSGGVFKITEDAERADAILRGSAEDQAYTEQHRSSDTISAGLHGGGFSSGKGSKASGANISENESSQSMERRHEASVSVRLVNAQGDVIWSTTQESLGAKFKSASADVADKILRRLMDDLQKARASAATQAGIPTR